MSKHRSSGRAPNQRQLRVGEQIRHLLSDILRHANLHDPDLPNPELVTVTAVELGPDLKHAHAYVMPLGGENAEVVIAALNRAHGYFRRGLGSKLNLRYTPQISFHADESFDTASHIDGLLKQDRVRRDVEKPDEVENGA